MVRLLQIGPDTAAGGLQTRGQIATHLRKAGNKFDECPTSTYTYVADVLLIYIFQPLIQVSTVYYLCSAVSVLL